MEQKEKTVLEKITGILSYLGYLSVVILLVLHLTRVLRVELFVYVAIALGIMVVKCIGKWKNERGSAIILLMSSFMLLMGLLLMLWMRSLVN